MSARSTLRALPTMLRVGLAEAVAYRAELLVWILSTTMPLVMLALFTAVAHDAPIGRFHERDFVAYFLATFGIRQLTSSWAAWQVNMDVRMGALAQRLLRPIHPIWAYACEQIASVPLRLFIAVPLAAVGLASVAPERLPTDFTRLSLVLLSIAGAWTITFFANVAMGALAFYLESSLKVVDVWIALYFVFSGYLVPIELFPGALRDIAELLPFRYQIGVPVEILIGAHAPAEALALVARQWTWAIFHAGLALLLWRHGIRRFAAYGG